MPDVEVFEEEEMARDEGKVQDEGLDHSASGRSTYPPDQMNQSSLQRLFSVERILSARGFRATTQGDCSDTVLPRHPWTPDEADLIFRCFRDATIRSRLLTTAGPEANEPTDLTKLRSLQGFDGARERVSHTFEWFVGELLVRRFRSLSSSYGVTVADVVRISDGETAGDYDVLSVMADTSLLYIECKSGKCARQKVLNTIERSHALSCAAAIVLLEAFDGVALKQQLEGVPYPMIGAQAALVEVIQGVLSNCACAGAFVALRHESADHCQFALHHPGAAG